MKTKFLIFGALGLLAVYKLRSKTNKIVKAIDNLDFYVKNIRSFKFNPRNRTAAFDFDLKIVNNSFQDLVDYLDLLRVNSIKFFYNGKMIAQADLPDVTIEIPANNSKIIKDLKMIVPWEAIGAAESMLENPDNLNFTYEVNYSIAGSEGEYAGTYGLNGICYNRAKCPGLKKNGQLKKGYRFIKGGAIKKSLIWKQ